MANEIINYEAQFAEDAGKYSKQEKAREGLNISTRGGILRVGFGEDAVEVPGNQLCTVVLDAINANTYFDVKFDPENPLPPKCYAFGRSDAEMFPHLETMRADQNYFTPQHIAEGQVRGCQGCPQAEWGSNDRGKGKACTNRRRLALLPAGMYVPQGRSWALDMYEDPKHFETAGIAVMSLPPTSIRAWGKYVQWLSQTHRRPPYGAVTRIFVEPDQKHQFHIEFEFIELVPPPLVAAIVQRHNDVVARELLIQGYPPPSEEAPRGRGGRR